MTVEWFRDLSISIVALVAVVVLVFQAVILYFVYRRVRRILASIEVVCANTQAISSAIKGIIKPLTAIINFFRGLFQGYGESSKTSQKGGKNE